LKKGVKIWPAVYLIQAAIKPKKAIMMQNCKVNDTGNKNKQSVQEVYRCMPLNYTSNNLSQMMVIVINFFDQSTILVSKLKDRMTREQVKVKLFAKCAYLQNKKA
jgi:hypothetical protein